MSDQYVDQVLLEGSKAMQLLLLGGPGGTAVFQNEISLSEFTSALGQQLNAQAPLSFGIIPHGTIVRDIHQGKGSYIFLIEIEPGLRTMKWIRDDSPAPYGSDATYRDVTVSLPFVYFFVSMHHRGTLHTASSVFFRNKPVQSLDDALCDCHFYNCSPHSYGVYCWICNQHYDCAKPEEKSLAEWACDFVDWFWFSGFNVSSEHHEGNSFFGKNRGVIRDKRVSTIRRWEKASKKDPLFAVAVPWIESGFTVRRVYNDLLRHVKGWNPSSSAPYANLIQRSCS